MRVETIAGHITQGPPHSQFYLIQPNASPFAYKQFRYFMNGKYTGEVFLTTTYECKFRSALTNITTPWHGKWGFCKHCRGIKAYFDVKGRPDNAIYRWTFLRGIEGVDYMGRDIQVYSNCGLGLECRSTETRDSANTSLARESSLPGPLPHLCPGRHHLGCVQQKPRRV